MYIYIYIYIYIYMYIYIGTQECTVSLGNHLRVVADAFRALRTHQRYQTSES